MASAEKIVAGLFTWLQDNVAKALFDLVSAVIILLIGFTIAKFVARFLYNLLGTIGLGRLSAKKGETRSIPLRNIISTSAAVIVYFVTLLLAFNQLGITSTVFYLLAGIVLIAVLAFVLLGFRDFIPNFFAGLILYNRQEYSTGDTVCCGKITGKVEKITLMETLVRTKADDLIHLPSLHIFKEKLKVMRSNGRQARRAA